MTSLRDPPTALSKLRQISTYCSDASSNLTKSVSYGLELANQVLDKEIEIEIDVDKVTEQVSNLATKTVSQSKVCK